MTTRRSFIRSSVLGPSVLSAVRESRDQSAEITMSVPDRQKICEEFDVAVSATRSAGLDSIFIAVHEPASLGVDTTYFKGSHECGGEAACSVDLTTWCAHESELALEASLGEADELVREPIEFQPNEDTSALNVEVRNEDDELTPVDHIALNEGLIGQDTTNRSAAEFRVPGEGRYEVSVSDSKYEDHAAEVYTSGDGEVKTIYLTERAEGATTERSQASAGRETTTAPAPDSSRRTTTASRSAVGSLERHLRNPLLQGFLALCTATGGFWAGLNIFKKLFEE